MDSEQKNRLGKLLQTGRDDIALAMKNAAAGEQANAVDLAARFQHEKASGAALRAQAFLEVVKILEAACR